jgi:acyl carrier protein
MAGILSFFLGEASAVIAKIACIEAVGKNVATDIDHRRTGVTQTYQSSIRTFIAENFLYRADAEIDDSQSLLDSGVMDSTGVLELIAFLEATYGISIADNEIVPENLDSIDRVSTYLTAKLAKA